MPNRNLADIRIHYQKDALDWDKLAADPLVNLRQWIDDAIADHLYEPTAMMLATVDAELQPHARVVLLKGLDSGLVFYTHYTGPKGQDLAHNPKAALTFFWPEMERQVRVEGRVEKVSAEESDRYFASRPRDSQLGACASAQGQVVANRAELEARFADMAAKFAGKAVQRPDHWGGYRLVPHRLEFWQGRPNRLHDRLVFKRQADGVWATERLAP
ncbi:MAG: pyridoxamine 5'-phosphate oxidase [Gammaproteobacteria bacterium]|nr:pyridoxamine 5'-phosphate oxidase [Gammaproteobacteria bacterium]